MQSMQSKPSGTGATMNNVGGLIGTIAILWLCYEIVVNLATPPIYGKFPSLVAYLAE